MTGYIIGVVIGVLIFLGQNFKPTSAGFRLLFFLVSIAFILGMFYAHLGYWNIVVIPLGEVILCFLSAFCFPYTGNAAILEYTAINGENYYAKLHNNDIIGRIQPHGFKQTYDRIMVGLLTQITSNQDDLQKLRNFIYSNNFYPISVHTKEEVLQHINSCIEKVAISSRYGDTLKVNANKLLEQLFNTFVSVMSIHEEAARNLE